jgi:hypothetical protein
MQAQESEQYCSKTSWRSEPNLDWSQQPQTIPSNTMNCTPSPLP